MVRERIVEILKRRFLPVHLDVTDESHLHAGHLDESFGNETHFSVIIVSDEFDGLSQVERHRQIFSALRKEFDATLHALKIKAYTPAEWNTLERRGDS